MKQDRIFFPKVISLVLMNSKRKFNLMLTIRFKIILGFIFLFFFPRISVAQHILVDTKWRDKVERALKIVERLEPDLFFQTLTKSTIQAGELAYIKAVAVANQEEVNDKKIQWILLDTRILNKWSEKLIAATIYHEALHHQYWDYYRGQSSNDQYLNEEHEVIFNQQLQFIKKLNSPSDQVYLVNLMKNLGIKIHR